jgi:hypothetical protein
MQLDAQRREGDRPDAHEVAELLLDGRGHGERVLAGQLGGRAAELEPGEQLADELAGLEDAG